MVDGSLISRCETEAMEALVEVVLSLQTMGCWA